jgi:hypothetical protein
LPDATILGSLLAQHKDSPRFGGALIGFRSPASARHAGCIPRLGAVKLEAGGVATGDRPSGGLSAHAIFRRFAVTAPEDQ